MKSELAEELLATLMKWDRSAFLDKVRHLEALAMYKYDDYSNFHPGVRFLESLGTWLSQFRDESERGVALEFVIERLVFISDAEMTHLIELVYPDHILEVIADRVAAQENLSRYARNAIVANDAFASLRRRSLIIGSSDGSHLDRLRRSASVLSHEQFLQTSEVSPELIRPMRKKLADALEVYGSDEDPIFRHIFIVDDFSGSGETLLRFAEGELKGKLAKLHRGSVRLLEEGLISEDFDVTVILYVATEQAKTHLKETIEASELPPWQVRVVQTIPASIRVDLTDPAFASLAEEYYDDVLTDEYKGRTPLGYANCALPLVLAHNTPNNSVSLLWADTTTEPGSRHRRALFPRYERHHPDRP